MINHVNWLILSAKCLIFEQICQHLTWFVISLSFLPLLSQSLCCCPQADTHIHLHSHLFHYTDTHHSPVRLLLHIFRDMKANLSCFALPVYFNTGFVCFVLGNKIDLADKREVLRQRAEDFAQAQSMLYLETSAKESDNVEKLFLDLACELIREAKQNKLDNNDPAPMPGEGKTISYLNCCSLN